MNVTEYWNAKSGQTTFPGCSSTPLAGSKPRGSDLVIEHFNEFDGGMAMWCQFSIADYVADSPVIAGRS
jgi:hypothetical protein